MNSNYSTGNKQPQTSNTKSVKKVSNHKTFI